MLLKMGSKLLSRLAHKSVWKINRGSNSPVLSVCMDNICLILGLTASLHADALASGFTHFTHHNLLSDTIDHRQAVLQSIFFITILLQQKHFYNGFDFKAT